MLLEESRRSPRKKKTRSSTSPIVSEMQYWESCYWQLTMLTSHVNALESIVSIFGYLSGLGLAEKTGVEPKIMETVEKPRPLSQGLPRTALSSITSAPVETSSPSESLKTYSD